MKLLILLLVFSFQLITAIAQTDSLSADRIKSVVETIESNLEADFELTADTLILDKEGNMTVHTKYYIDRGSGEVEKIIEKTIFGQVTTEITVYYVGRSAILFTSKQWQGPDLKLDFDYYFQANSPIYLVKRTFGKGKPSSEEILKWCDQLIKESDSKKALAKAELEKQVPKTKLDKKPVEKTTTDSTKKPTSTKKPFLPFFKKKKN